mmetsp:Transcript_24592/g.44217  ORF Transcript_24592/g.44217 Transcript_24592/m.44217 type:complete len:251 (+) Transcript_24592:866-1618(+)
MYRNPLKDFKYRVTSNRNKRSSLPSVPPWLIRFTTTTASYRPRSWAQCLSKDKELRWFDAMTVVGLKFILGSCVHSNGMLPRTCTNEDVTFRFGTAKICSVSTKFATCPAASAPRRHWRVPARSTPRRAMRVRVPRSRVEFRGSLREFLMGDSEFGGKLRWALGIELLASCELEFREDLWRSSGKSFNCSTKPQMNGATKREALASTKGLARERFHKNLGSAWDIMGIMPCSSFAFTTEIRCWLEVRSCE